MNLNRVFKRGGGERLGDSSVSSPSGSLPGREMWWSGLSRYAVAVGAVGVATAAQWGVSGVLGNKVPFIIFYPAVAATGIIAGMRAGLLATVLSALAADWLFLEPQFSLKVGSTANVVALGLFTIAGVLMSVLGGIVERAREREWRVRERERATEEIRRSEAAARARAGELAAIMDAMPMITLIAHDRQGRQMSANRAGYELLRIPHGANISKSGPPGECPGSYRIFKGDRELRPEEMPVQQAAATGQEVRDFEARVVLADGSWRDISGNAVPLLDERGQPRGAVGAFMDVTERCRLEEALRESERKFRALFDHARDAVLIYDMMAGHFADANREACERLGYSREELLRMGPQDIDSPEAAAKVPARLEELLREGHALFETEQQRRDGSRVLVELNSSLVELGGAKLVFSTCRDISARKAAEEALRRAEARLAQAMRVAGLGTFEHDHLTGIIELSPVLREMYGFGQEESVGLAGVLERMWPEDRERAAATIRQAHDPAGSGAFTIEHRLRVPRQRIRWVSVRSQTYFEGEGSQRHPVRTIGAVLDITEQKESEAKLERLVAERTAELRELVGELEHLSYTLAHDLRAPLRAIQGFAAILTRQSNVASNPQSREYCGRMMSGAERLDQLIVDALNYTKLVRQSLPLQPVELGRLLRGLVDTYPNLEPSKAEIQISGELPAVMGNEALLTQCFSNLLGNAVKFVAPGTRPRVQVRAESKDGWVRVWVEDNGPGIPREWQQRIFDLFQRMHSNAEGTGLGLAIVRKAVERMGGRVGVESELGKGSRFWVELKAAN